MSDRWLPPELRQEGVAAGPLPSQAQRREDVDGVGLVGAVGRRSRRSSLRAPRALGLRLRRRRDVLALRPAALQQQPLERGEVLPRLRGEEEAEHGAQCREA